MFDMVSSIGLAHLFSNGDNFSESYNVQLEAAGRFAAYRQQLEKEKKEKNGCQNPIIGGNHG